MKLFFNILIVLLVCCITVGAFNIVNGTNNRPLTLYETISFFADFQLPLTEFQEVYQSLIETWSLNTSKPFASAGGSGSNSGGGGNIPGLQSPVERYNGFLSAEFVSDTGNVVLDGLLNFINDLCVSLMALGYTIYLFIKYSLVVFVQYIDLVTKLLFGVPT